MTLSLLFSWFHNNTEHLIQNDGKSTIIITNVQQYHAGTYTCVASNLYGDVNATINLIITSKLSIAVL